MVSTTIVHLCTPTVRFSIVCLFFPYSWNWDKHGFKKTTLWPCPNYGYRFHDFFEIEKGFFSQRDQYGKKI
jgi:hypothetical protein